MTELPTFTDAAYFVERTETLERRLATIADLLWSAHVQTCRIGDRCPACRAFELATEQAPSN